jgi:hypothetical protein
MSKNSVAPDLLETLKKARKIIAKTENHCKGWLAEDKNGNATHVSSPEARKFCIEGACIKASNEWYMIPPELVDAFFGGCVPIFNDSKTHAEVLLALDQTIEYVELTT